MLTISVIILSQGWNMVPSKHGGVHKDEPSNEKCDVSR